MNERERLAACIAGASVEEFRKGAPALREHFMTWAGRALEAIRNDPTLTCPPAPTPRPVWPGLEGEEGMARNEQVWSDAHRSALERGYSPEDAIRHAVTIRTAHLFRSLVAGLPADRRFDSDSDLVGCGGYAIPRSALAALADPYDGGGK